MFPDSDLCPFYGCVCWLCSCPARERESKRGRGGWRKEREKEKLEGRLSQGKGLFGERRSLEADGENIVVEDAKIAGISGGGHDRRQQVGQ